MSFLDYKKKENLFALLDWVDCDKRRIEMARPVMISEMELKLSFFEWLNIPMFEYKPPKKQIWKRIKSTLKKQVG